MVSKGSKQVSTKSGPAIRGGGESPSGPTGSSRTYAKGGGVKASFTNPMQDKKRSGTKLFVGGV